MNIIKLKSLSATIVAAVLMGCLGFLVRQAGMDAGVTAFFRFLIGFFLLSCVVLIPAVVNRRRVSFSLSSFFSGMAISLCILCYFFAIQRASIGLAAFILYLGPVFAIVGEAIISRKLPSSRQFVVIGLAFAGFVLISSLDVAQFASADSGLMLALLSGLFYGAYILINRFIPQQVTLNIRVFWQFLAAVLTIGATLLLRDVSFEGFGTGWPYLLTIGVVQGFIVLMLTGYAIKNLSSVEFGALSYVEPLVAVMLGFYLYDESLSLVQVAGIVLIVAATVLQCMTIDKKQ